MHHYHAIRLILLSFDHVISHQFYNIQNGSGSIGGGASYIVSLINTVPIALSVFQLSNDLDILNPSPEPYEDLNENESENEDEEEECEEAMALCPVYAIGDDGEE